jgi:tetratricopeptide (TPR) repeat protein
MALGVAMVTSRAVTWGGPGVAATDTAITSRSIAFFEQRLARDPYNYLAGGQLVARYLMRFQLGGNLADVAGAEVVARSIMPVVSDTAGAYARLGVVYLTQHKFVEAYDAARRAIARNPRNEEALGLLFDTGVATGRYAVAESALARLRPGRMAYQLRLGHMLSARGNMDGAYHMMDRACRQLARAQVKPQAVAWCVTELAKIQHAREGEPAAAALYHRALRVQPGYRAALEGLADLAYARGDWAVAARLLQRIAVDAHPDLYLRQAEVHRAMGQSAAAEGWERAFLRVARARGAEALYAHPLALYYAASPLTLDTALAIARRDVARRPAVESWDVLSWVLFRRGELTEALAASDRSRCWGAPSPTMDYHRARILEALGRGSEAAALLRLALARPSLLEPHVRWELRQVGAAAD